MTTDLSLTPITQPLTIFLLGATGDLAKKKILKAIFELYRQKYLPQPFTLIAVGRSQLTTKEYLHLAVEAIQPKEVSIWEEFRDSIHYISGDLTQLETYEAIKGYHDNLKVCGNHLWYAATLPSLYVDIARFIGQVGLNTTACGWTKFLIEKPFGTDLESAQQLNQFLSTIFQENQIYRIDHFLAKETVQNLLAFRFANGIFEHIWHHNYIDHMQVTAAETIGVEGRGEFYEGVGAVRDVLQNHVLQLIATTMMEEPRDLSAAAISQVRNQLLSQLSLDGHPCTAARFGQYDSYAADAGLAAASSRTETAVALKLAVNNARWQGMPVYVRAGKRLAQGVIEISIQFKEPKNPMFKSNGSQLPNVLTLRIQPNEGVVLRLSAKKPGLQLAIEPVPMQFCYKNTFAMDLIEAYVKLIHDAIAGDAMLFPDKTGSESAWSVVEPILAYKRQPEFTYQTYPSGSWGPESFDTLMKADGREWLEPSELFCLPRRSF